MRRVAYGVVLLALLAGCKKDRDKSPSIDFGPNGGITEKDAINEQSGKVDPTDWTADQTWQPIEQALFQDSGIDVNQPGQGDNLSLNVYPNPVAEQAAFSTYPRSSRQPVPANLQGIGIVVDKKYHVLRSFPFRVNYQMRLDFKPEEYQSGQLYRMYYIVYDANNVLYLKGHGDIKISR